MKLCSKCNKIKKLEEFDKRCAYCKVCRRLKQNLYHKKHPQKYNKESVHKQYLKNRTKPEYKKYHALQQAKYRKKLRNLGLYKFKRGNRINQSRNWKAKPRNLLKNFAHQKLYRAIKQRLIKRQPCQICKTDKFVCGHHPLYNKPLEVVWLCNLHHYQVHKGIIKL